MKLLNAPTKVNLILLMGLAILFTLLYVISSLTAVFILLGATLIVAYLLLGPTSFLEQILRRNSWVKRHISAERIRAVSILSIYVLFFLLICLTLLRGLPPLSAQLREFTSHDLPLYLSQLDTQATPGENGQDGFWDTLFKAMLTEPAQSPATVNGGAATTDVRPVPAEGEENPVIRWISQYTTNLASYLISMGANAVAGVLYVLTLLVMVFYLLQDGHALKVGFINLLPNRIESPFDWFLERLHRQFYSFIKGQVIVSILSGVLMYFLLELLGVKYAFMLGFVFGLVSIIPVLGPWFGLLPILLVVAFSAPTHHILNVLIFTGLFYVLKVYWLWPRMIPSHLDIHPALFLIVFLVCLKLGGFLGILMAFPISSIISVGLDALQQEALSSETPHTPS